MKFTSARGMDLVWWGDGGDGSGLPPIPTITVELWNKWYQLWLVNTDGSVQAIDYHDMGETNAAIPRPHYIDHVPNPRAVEAYADAKSYTVCDMAMEMMIGRWRREVMDE